jgi:serine/threonine-protein kinase
MGVVYAAVDEVLERPVAVKVIRDEIVGPLNLADRFRREARAAAAFAHPHVVRVYDFGVDRSSRAFLVMELLEGTTLRQRMASGSPLAAPEALHVLRGVCAALSAAHGQGIVHRDLKPENIFLQRHATGIVPKVLDFGLAKAFDARPATDRSTAMGTSAGLLVGTLAYMSPEQVAGDDVSPGWDVWAAGVIAYEMLTGIHPFSRAVAVVGKGLADLSAGGRQSVVLSEPVSGFFRRALSTERSLRPREARDLLSECERVLA